MKRFFLLAFISIFTISAFAQRQRASFEQFQQMKLDFIVKEMGLTQAEINKFAPIYKELSAEKSALYRKYRASNGAARRAMREGKELADTTMQRISREEAQLQIEDAKIEQEYQQKFEAVLTPQQIFDWREAEKKFRTEVMRRR